ncbi:hypothetical protein BN2537_2443 [Streptomyces venezuelae]|nr:hypothetical protein BN2537_2443 [Streptomyces venezuelae]
MRACSICETATCPRGCGETAAWSGRESPVGSRYPAAQRGQRGNSGASNCRARAACWGTTPLPSAVSCAGRPSPGVAVTQPASRPCIHSTKSGRSRPAASVGAGAGRVSVSHRVMADAYGPHCWSAPRIPGTAPPTAAGPPPAAESAAPCRGDGPCRRSAGRGRARLPHWAGSCPRSRAAGWARPCSRPTPSASAGATRPRRPGSDRGPRSSSSTDAGSRRSCRCCLSAS